MEHAITLSGLTSPSLGHIHSPLLTNPNVRKRVMDQQIKACLEAMVENRRFTYTDIFLMGGQSTMHHANALFVKVMRP